MSASAISSSLTNDWQVLDINIEDEEQDEDLSTHEAPPSVEKATPFETASNSLYSELVKLIVYFDENPLSIDKSDIKDEYVALCLTLLDLYENFVRPEPNAPSTMPINLLKALFKRVMGSFGPIFCRHFCESLIASLDENKLVILNQIKQLFVVPDRFSLWKWVQPGLDSCLKNAWEKTKKDLGLFNAQIEQYYLVLGKALFLIGEVICNTSLRTHLLMYALKCFEKCEPLSNRLPKKFQASVERLSSAIIDYAKPQAVSIIFQDKQVLLKALFIPVISQSLYSILTSLNCSSINNLLQHLLIHGNESTSVTEMQEAMKNTLTVHLFSKMSAGISPQFLAVNRQEVVTYCSTIASSMVGLFTKDL